jgi:hypothetical protein
VHVRGLPHLVIRLFLLFVDVFPLSEAHKLAEVRCNDSITSKTLARRLHLTITLSASFLASYFIAP